MDLDLSPEQEMLREMVRGVCSYVRAARDRARARRRSGRLPARPVEADGRARPHRVDGPGRLRRLGDERARRRGRLHGARARARPDSALRERGDGVPACCCERGARSRSASGCRGSSRGDAIVSTAWLEPGNGFGAARRAGPGPTADGDGFVLDGVKWHVPFASAATAMVVLARTGAGDADVDLFLVDTGAPGRHAEPAADHRVRHAVRGRAQRRARAGDGSHRRRGHRLGTPGTRRCSTGSCSWPRRRSAAPATRSTSRCSTRRTASSSASRSARSRRSRTTSPTRSRPSTAPRRWSTRRPGRTRDGRSIERLAPDGEALRVQDLPGRHRHGPAGVRRGRLHPRVRHPALLPAGEAAPDLVVGRPPARGADRGDGARRRTCNRFAAEDRRKLDRMRQHIVRGAAIVAALAAARGRLLVVLTRTDKSPTTVFPTTHVPTTAPGPATTDELADRRPRAAPTTSATPGRGHRRPPGSPRR